MINKRIVSACLAGLAFISLMTGCLPNATTFKDEITDVPDVLTAEELDMYYYTNMLKDYANNYNNNDIYDYIYDQMTDEEFEYYGKIFTTNAHDFDNYYSPYFGSKYYVIYDTRSYSVTVGRPIPVPVIMTSEALTDEEISDLSDANNQIVMFINAYASQYYGYTVADLDYLWREPYPYVRETDDYISIIFQDCVFAADENDLDGFHSEFVISLNFDKTTGKVMFDDEVLDIVGTTLDEVKLSMETEVSNFYPDLADTFSYVSEHDFAYDIISPDEVWAYTLGYVIDDYGNVEHFLILDMMYDGGHKACILDEYIDGYTGYYNNGIIYNPVEPSDKKIELEDDFY